MSNRTGSYQFVVPVRRAHPGRAVPCGPAALLPYCRACQPSDWPSLQWPSYTLTSICS